MHAKGVPKSIQIQPRDLQRPRLWDLFGLLREADFRGVLGGPKSHSQIDFWRHRGGGTHHRGALGLQVSAPALGPGGRLDIYIYIYTTTPTEKKFGVAGLTYAIARRFILILLVSPLIDSVSARPGMRLNCENEVYSTWQTFSKTVNRIVGPWRCGG